MKELVLIMPEEPSPLLKSMVKAAANDRNTINVKDDLDIPELTNKKIIFAVELNKAGLNITFAKIISKLFERGKCALKDSEGILFIHSPSELYTKSYSQSLIFLANSLGCRFPGHPLVEATVNLENFLTWQKKMGMPLEDICIELSRRLGQRFSEYSPLSVEKPNILVLHSSLRKTSNTLELWHMASRHLSSCSIIERHVENGEVLECKGCSYKTCVHYSKQNSCFYGGTMVKDILPSVEKSDAVVWICPNYNDAVSANLTAVINRMTALYRKMSFHNKCLFAVIVSGNSGSDSVAKQLIGALNINKGFDLPPYFSLIATANDPGQVESIPYIEDMAWDFADNMKRGMGIAQ